MAKRRVYRCTACHSDHLVSEGTIIRDTNDDEIEIVAEWLRCECGAVYRADVRTGAMTRQVPR